MGLASSSATSTTTAPDFYTNYLTNLATQGQSAVNQMTGPSGTGTLANLPNANQLAAFQGVQNNVGNYMPGLTAAGATTNLAGGLNMAQAANPYLSTAQGNLNQGVQGADQLVGNYMNPYTQNVVDQIRAANQQNIQQNLSPGLTAGAVGAGQFGSQRGANALAMGISNANLGALTAQSTALQSGYTEALKAAQQQRLNQLAAGATGVQAGSTAANAAAQAATNYLNTGKQQAALADQTQTAGLADVNALANLGAQQQTIALNAANYPMSVLGEQSKLMSGQSIPMSTVQTMEGSPLSMIAGLGGLTAGLFSSPAGGTSPIQGFTNWWNGLGTTTNPNPVDTSNTGDQGKATNDALANAGAAYGAGDITTSGDTTQSDRRLKTDIEPVGKMDNGLTVYRYRYKAGGPIHIGVMADEVEKIRPEAYVKGGAGGGFDAVNYAKL